MTKHVQEQAGVDIYQVFYVEAIMQDSSFPQIHTIKPIFEKISLKEFIGLLQRVMETNDYEITQQFLYFLLLFRDMPHIQDYINSEEFDIAILEKFVIFTHGYCSLHDHSTERIIDEILYFLSNERLLQLVLFSEFISRDKLLLFFILSKFDAVMLDKYFASVKNITGFVDYFLNLPEEILRSIISRNYHLFQYLLMMLSENDSEQTIANSFYKKYSDDIAQFSKLSNIIRNYKKETDFEKEKKLPFNQRDMSRISFLVNMIRELPDSAKAIEYFSNENVFIDEMEKKIVHAVVSDPILKNTFAYYDKMFEVS